jgi:caa(3)-type oxidase subunit IV
MRGIKRPPTPEATARGERPHPGPAQYVKIGILIVLTEALEIGTFYTGLGQWARISLLIPLMVVNFGLIALWFMHLRFDSPYFSWMFVGGLLLAAALFAVVLVTLGGGLF